jgi:hypothetical protein
MAEFLTTRNVSSSIIDIIRQADQEICLVCPYIRFADQVAERLSDADRDGKDILVVYGKEDLRDDTRRVLSGLQTTPSFPNFPAAKARRGSASDVATGFPTTQTGRSVRAASKRGIAGKTKTTRRNAATPAGSPTRRP